MALRKTNESPRITDTVLLEIVTPDAYGCYPSNPYKVDRVVIYYVERDFLGTNFGEYEKVTIPDALIAEYTAAQKALCASPTQDNYNNLIRIQGEIESASQRNLFYYKDRSAVAVIGSEGFPAWLSTDPTESKLTLVSEDENGDPQYGHFTYEWNPNGAVREGDYFVCWTWTPLPAGNKLSAHIQFSLAGDPNAVMSIPTHVTPEDKYDTLLERYLPEMYKYTLADGDETPQTLDTFNQAIAQGFTFIEDMANQIIDLFDANALHESLLVYLSNLFNIKLKSNDPTLWRRQIKEAIPLFKKKGTLEGLEEAFAQAGMVLNKFTQFWQIVSPYTWQESFLVKTSPTFTLAKPTVITPIDPANFGLWLKREGTHTYQSIPPDYVVFDVGDDSVVRMTWIGDELSANPIELMQGDHLRVLYQYNEIPRPTEQQLENYIRSLPLADQRDEDDQQYPLKNWNVRLIAEEDPLFDVLIPVRHPFADPLVFGFYRTEFAYSENIYNMEEYNGSTRPSFDPCRIDKDFLDPCGACLSSKFAVDIGVEELSNDRMLEAQDILREYTPFHAQVHSLNFIGEVNEFVQPAVETIETLITIDYSQFILSGQSNPFFNRFIEGGLQNWIVTRDDLTNQLTVLSGKIGTAYNDHVRLVTPDIILQDLGVVPDYHILEVLAPSANAGTYLIKDIHENTAKLASTVIEGVGGVDQSAFTFNISNILYSTSVAEIAQDNLCILSDENTDFDLLSVKTLWDVEHTPDYTGGTWKVLIPAYSPTPYEIRKIEGGALYLKDDGTLPTVDTTGIAFTLLNDLDEEIASSVTSSLDVTFRGYVNLNDSGFNPTTIQQYIHVYDLLFYSGTEYLIVEFDGKNFWIEGYSGGDVAGVNVQTRRRLATQEIGYFGYKGLRLTTFADHEAEFEMINGSNPTPVNDQKDGSNFKENYLFLINGDYYKIVEIDEKEVILAGRENNWKTLVAGGTTVAYSMVHLNKKEVNVGFVVFDFLDHNCKDPIIREIEDTVTDTVAIVALSASSGTGIQEHVAQDEGISFIIERRSGDTQEGEL
jgi:hypothetical protein